VVNIASTKMMNGILRAARCFRATPMHSGE
jgi:hypothetical protein